jgi:hypothetical protein
MEHRTTRASAVAVLICGACTALALSSPAEAGQPGIETFQGVCMMSGAIRHEPALTMEPVPTQIYGRFNGTCTGELTERDGQTRQLDEAPARYEVRDAGGDLSCNGGTATGTGSLLFGRGREIEFSLTERRPGPALAVVTLQGSAGGSATLFGTVSPNEDLAGAIDRCSGPGLRVVHADARIVSPGISG